MVLSKLTQVIILDIQEEIEFRKKINKKNILRKMIKEKKSFLSKLSQNPSCTEEYLKIQKDIKTLEDKLNEL